ncbi:hypothetical protein F5050DRAFT_1716373 [Lentinula boryana]|uniref:Uncharacterized protein n=1 Tax=Lentinula boryana TaxID=40481 RepID=A0ABQ8PXD1_9AGAR|nr:hypothetical protein F5050DRAFT_1716373 [Lentinula boryana]
MFLGSTLIPVAKCLVLLSALSHGNPFLLASVFRKMTILAETSMADDLKFKCVALELWRKTKSAKGLEEPRAVNERDERHAGMMERRNGSIETEIFKLKYG